MNRIEVNGIHIYAYHGCLPEEERIGGNYIVDLIVDTDFSESVETDKLADTIDYVALNRIVEEEMAVRSKLIEQVGGRILKRIKELDRRISQASVKVRKLTPPINGNVDEVAIIISG
jgi:dihydroneopterin aldolase